MPIPEPPPIADRKPEPPQYQNVVTLQLADDDWSLVPTNHIIHDAYYTPLTPSPSATVEFEPGPEFGLKVIRVSDNRLIQHVVVPASRQVRSKGFTWNDPSEVKIDFDQVAHFRLTIRERLLANYKPSRWVRVIETRSQNPFYSTWFGSELSNEIALTFQTNNSFLQFASVTVIDPDRKILDRTFKSVKDGDLNLQVFSDLPPFFRFKVESQYMQTMVLTGYLFQ